MFLRLAKKMDFLRCCAGLILFCSLGLISVGAEVVRLPPFLTARNRAMGGVHAALADDFSVLYNNPAGYVMAEPELHLVDLSVHLQGPVFSMADAILAGELEKLFSEGLARRVGLGIQGPVSFGYVGGGLGFGIHNYTDSTISVPGITRPAKAEISENFLLSGGYTVRFPLPERLPLTLDAGFLFKGFVEGGVQLEKDAVELIGMVSSFNPQILLGQEFYLQTGIGADLGLLTGFWDTLFLGISFRDVYSPAKRNVYTSFASFQAGEDPARVVDGFIPFDMSVGLMWQPIIPLSFNHINEFRLMLDYKDIWDFAVAPTAAANPILHLGLGAEAVMLDILSVRVGMDEGLLNAGMGLDLFFFQINAAMFGSEMGSEPGMLPVYNMMVSIEFAL